MMTGRPHLVPALAAIVAAAVWLLLAPFFLALFMLAGAVMAVSIRAADASTGWPDVAGHALRALLLIVWASIAVCMLLGPVVPAIGENATLLLTSIDTNMTGGQQLIPWLFLPFVALCGLSLWRSIVRLRAGLRRPVDWACLALGPLAALGVIGLGMVPTIITLISALQFAQAPYFKGFNIALAWLPFVLTGATLCAHLWRGTLPLVPAWPGMARRLTIVLDASLIVGLMGGIAVLLVSIVIDSWVGLVSGTYVALIHAFTFWQGRRAGSGPHKHVERTTGLLVMLTIIDGALAIFASAAMSVAVEKGPMPYDLIIPPFVIWLCWRIHQTIGDWLNAPMGKARDLVRQPLPEDFTLRATYPAG